MCKRFYLDSITPDLLIDHLVIVIMDGFVRDKRGTDGEQDHQQKWLDQMSMTEHMLMVMVSIHLLILTHHS